MSESDSTDVQYDVDAGAMDDTAHLAGDPLTDGGVVETSDISGDGVPDFVIERLTDGSLVAVSDDNGDRLADTMGVDLDGDGDFELVVTRVDGGYHVQVDQDGDGTFEYETDMTRESLLAVDPGVVEALDLQFGAEPVTPEYDGEAESTVVVDGQLVGDPRGDSEHWFEQSANGFCVPASIAQIVSEYTGVHFDDEQQFVARANELNVFEVGPDGVPGIGVDGALALLEDAGVPASIEFGSGVETLVDYLDEGRRVMLAVDSGEIWQGEAVEDNAPDHALVVSGVDVGRGVVIVSDPGDPDGNQKEYPIDVFEDAWADSGYAAVVCDVTPEEFAASSGEAPAAAAPAGKDAGIPGIDISGALTPADVSEVEQAEGHSAVETAVDWAIDHSWAILPVALGVGAVARARK